MKATVIVLSLTLLWLAYDWRSNYQYKPFTAYLRDEARQVEVLWYRIVPQKV